MSVSSQLRMKAEAIRARLGRTPVPVRPHPPTGKGQRIDPLYGKHAGQPIFVLGNSYSLKEMDLTPLKDYVTIGVNRILSTFTPTYLFVVDRMVIHDEWQRMNAAVGKVQILLFPSALSCAARGLYKGAYIEIPPITCKVDPRTKTGPISIGRVGNTSYEAAQVAYRMGASEIIFAGLDLSYQPFKPTHCVGFTPSCAKMRDPARQVEQFGELKNLYKGCGVEVFSCSPWKTKLRKVLGYVPLPELHKRLKESS